uniref:Uncharacterized protein n=1 Tax=Clastoptera arizonana TaxID=38151 RepID=A0A1B6D651_9HEMI
MRFRNKELYSGPLPCSTTPVHLPHSRFRVQRSCIWVSNICGFSSALKLLNIFLLQVVEVLDLIFHHPKHRYPSIEELLLCDFFRNIDLREMRATSLPQVYHARLTTSTLSLLNEVKKHQNNKRCRRTQSSSTPPDPASPSRRRERLQSSSEGESAEDDSGTPDSPYESDNDTEGELSQEHRNLSLHTQQSLININLETQRLLR